VAPVVSGGVFAGAAAVFLWLRLPPNPRGAEGRERSEAERSGADFVECMRLSALTGLRDR